MRKTFIILALCAVATVAALVWLGTKPDALRTLKQRSDEVASTLRCPVCESLSVKDSTSDVAREMHTQITDQLRAGRSADEIRQSFVAAYGESVLLAPEPTGINLVAWAVPIAALLGGGLLLVVVVRRLTTPEGRSA